jgi:hypothetical protein
MLTLPLNVLMKYPSSQLVSLINEAGSSIPDESHYCGGANLPTIFKLNAMKFGESTKPLYDLQVAEQLHPNDNYKNKAAKMSAVQTLVMTNPVPRQFTKNSLKLLELIKDC